MIIQKKDDMKIRGIILILVFSALVSTQQAYSNFSIPFNGGASLFLVSGDVKVIAYGTKMGSPAKKDMIVYPGDWIKTGPNAFVSLAFDEKAENVIRVGENSLVNVKMDGYYSLELLDGQLYAILEQLNFGDKFRVLLPSMVAETEHKFSDNLWDSVYNARWDGEYSYVSSLEEGVNVSGIDKDGGAKFRKFNIDKGYQRKAAISEDPGKQEPAPNVVLLSTKDQLTSHVETIKDNKPKMSTKANSAEKILSERRKNISNGRNVFVLDGEEINIKEYLEKHNRGEE